MNKLWDKLTDVAAYVVAILGVAAIVLILLAVVVGAINVIVWLLGGLT